MTQLDALKASLIRDLRDEVRQELRDEIRHDFEQKVRAEFAEKRAEHKESLRPEVLAEFNSPPARPVAHKV